MTYHCAILKNAATGRFHPMPFRPHPLPSEELVFGQVCRHKSIGHHTEGFDSLELADAHIAEKKLWPTGLIYEWDGVDIPATIGYFPYETPVRETIIS